MNASALPSHPTANCSPSSAVAVASKSNQLKPTETNSHYFADKVADHPLPAPAAPLPSLSGQCHLLTPNDTKSHLFADKVRIVEAVCRPARFILLRRRAGKIAHLPPEIREQINVMLRDGLPYAVIIAKLGN